MITLDTQVGIPTLTARWSRWRAPSSPHPASFTPNSIPNALPEILAGVRLGAIRGVKGVVIGQLLVAIIGVGELFEVYSNNFLMEEFWALVTIVFLFAFAVLEAIALPREARRVYAASPLARGSGRPGAGSLRAPRDDLHGRDGARLDVRAHVASLERGVGPHDDVETQGRRTARLGHAQRAGC